MKNTEVECY